MKSPRRQIIHLAKVTERKWGTTTGTACDRMTTGNDGFNRTGDKLKVTCKLCLKKIGGR